MKYSKDDNKEIIRRMLWIDNEHIKLLNRDGIEKIVDFTKGFKEKAYNVITCFDPESY